MKNSSTKTIVATGLGAALFLVLFMFVKIPSPIPDTSFQIAYGISGFFAALFGPLCGFLVAFIGHALNDFIGYGSPWWSWVIASGISGLITGLCRKKVAPAVEDGRFGRSEFLTYLLFTVIAHALSWLLIAPTLDVVIYAESAALVYTQGVLSFVIDAVTAVVVGGLLLKAYAATRVSKGSLKKED
jgi:energy-coupling factor transport system substrate-specific component